MLADLFDPKKLLSGINLFIGAASCVLLSVVSSGEGQLGFLLGTYAVISFVEGAYKPALAGTLVRLKRSDEGLKRVNTVLNALSMLVVILAGCLSVLLDLKHEPTLLLVFCAAGFLLGSLLLARVEQNPSPRAEEGMAAPSVKDLATGLDRPIMLTALSALIYALCSLAMVQHPFRVFENGAAGMGGLFVASGLGILVGALSYKRLGLMRAPSLPQSSLLILLSACGMVAFALSHVYGGALVAILATMGLFSMAKLALDNFLIVSLPKALVGRAFAFLAVIEEACIGLGTLAYAEGYESWAPPGFTIAAASVLAGLAGCFWLSLQTTSGKEWVCILNPKLAKTKRNQVA